VLRIGAVFAIFAAFTHWFPLLSGITLHQSWRKAQFFLIFTGVNLTFFPQHFLGLAGMPRRYSDYPDAFIKWNVVSSFGSLLSFVALILFIFILWEAFSTQRTVAVRSHIPTSIEWRDILPLDFHNLNETGLIYTHYKWMPNGTYLLIRPVLLNSSLRWPEVN
jgi:cytochrome c oxidase subunit 1